MTRKVTVIPATKNILTHQPIKSTAKRKVAAYARVSTDSEEQLTSYEAQVDYYTKYIKDNPDWKFVKVYTDEGITATNTKRRDGFKNMIDDALAGKIDLIVTKSVSRFARNTVDSLITVRKLKEKGIEIFFEKENIYTLDSKGELLITIMSSLAQEESRSISENVTWGQRKRFADGKVSLPYKNFLGYERGKDGFPKVVPEQAKIVQYIYRLYINGKTPTAIAKILTEKGIATPSGKSKWASNGVMSILTNEKYKGSAILQKKFTVDFLTKKQKINEGEVPQYYVENSHEAIIDPREWEAVQIEIARRRNLGSSYSGNSVFAARLVCADCGSFYGSKVWQSNTKYRRVIWQCNNKFKNEKKCTTPHITEDEIKVRFLHAVDSVITSKEQLVEDCELICHTLTDCAKIDTEIGELKNEIEIITAMTKKCVEKNATTTQNQVEYLERYNRLVDRYEKAKSRLVTLQNERDNRIKKSNSIKTFANRIIELDEAPAEFDEILWLQIIKNVLVHADGQLTFVLKNGTQIKG